MASSSGLVARYLGFCGKHRVPPNSEVVAWFTKAARDRILHGESTVVVSLDHLADADIRPLVDTFTQLGPSEIDAVDIVQKSPGSLNADVVMSLVNSIGSKLYIIDFQDPSFGEDFLRRIAKDGIGCRILNFWMTQIQKLNMAGRFSHLHFLNLDFCMSITSLHKDCFSDMPKLVRLSMCETRITNLGNTTAVLSKLPCLEELRFQKCLCCLDTGPCSSFHDEKVGRLRPVKTGPLLTNEDCDRRNMLYEDSEPLLSSHIKKMNLFDSSKAGQFGIDEGDTRDGTVLWRNYISHHPSPICFEKYYREHMIACLPELKVLDNLPIQEKDRKLARTVFSRCYEQFPYKRMHAESVLHVLHERQMGQCNFFDQNTRKIKKRVSRRPGSHFFSRSLNAAKVGLSFWPLIQAVSPISHLAKEDNLPLRPRQFEYHPVDPSLMAFGTLDGELIIINHENGKLFSHVSSTGMPNSILGLCWLKKFPSKLIAGSDNGSLRLFDVNLLPPKVPDLSYTYDTVAYDDFEHLTSVHVNSTDDWFLTSGYTKDIALYDVASGKRLNLLSNLHSEPINVAKFAHHCPFLFATSSFDRDVKMWDLRQKLVKPCYRASSSRGNVMVCFSPDDVHLLVSAVDNEVKQLLAVDGRLHLDLNIASSGSAQNYTRSYYMNGGDYIISGSSDEHVVRICCAQTGRRLRDVVMEDGESGNSLFVQSLRGDPFRDFHFSILAASTRRSSKWEIVKVNLLASDSQLQEQPHGQGCLPFNSLGG
ncbi:hypothetical protein MLD38_031397 [Melastoma candidum]|uniref:Uncharacterized protein n=1 Tax=Melastoma candidum TaxID=119954 RepID=A0ACB9MRG2_9MYRT|nr:hypothetical protein MLD38_031397 [Melastoma candidum]